MPEKERKRLGERALLHAPLLADGIPSVPMDSSGFMDWLMKAPESAAYEIMLGIAFDSRIPAARRGKVVLRMIRAWGERSADDLISLARPGQSPEILRSLFAGLRTFAKPRHAAALLSADPGNSRGLEGLWLEAYSSCLDSVGRIGLMERTMQVGNRGLLQRMGRNAWEEGSQVALLRLFWEWTDERTAAIWQAGYDVLSDLLPPAEVVAGLKQRFDLETTPEGRFFRVEQARRLRSEESLDLYCEWLASPEGLTHPQSGTLAAILFQEERARPAFNIWWSKRDSLRPDQIASAAICLAPVDPSAREFVWEILPQQSPPAQQAWILHLSQDPQAGDAARCAALVRDPTASAQVRKVGAVGLVRGLPESLPQFKDVFQDLLATPGMEPEAARQMVLGGIHFGEMETRNWVRSEVEALPDSHPLRPRLASAIARARTSSPQEVEQPSDLASVQQGLLLPLADLEPSLLPPVEGKESTLPGCEGFFRNLRILGAHGLEVDSRLAEWMASRSHPERLHPDRLWLLSLKDSVLPEASRVAMEFLTRFESPRSWRLTAPLPTPPPLGWNLEPDPNVLFNSLAESALGSVGSESFEQTLESSRARFPHDRRAFDISGWWALSQGRFDDARHFFRLSSRRSGLLPVTQREPRLGLAACDELQDPSSSTLEDHLRLYDSRKLLSSRLVGDARARLSGHLEEPGEEPLSQ